jgi:WD40 repeat protein
VARWDLRKVHPEALAWPAHTEEPRVRDTAVYGLGFTADGSEILSSAHATVRSWHPDGRPGRISIDQYRLPCQFPPVQDRVPVYVPEWRRHWILSLPDREVRHTGDGVRGRWPLAVAPGGRLIAFMPDNAGGPGLQAVDDPDARPRLLAAPSGAPVEMPGVTFLGFDPTGTLLVSVEEVAGRVRLWDVATGLLAAERLTAADATRAAFSPDGRRLAVCGGHGVALFDIPSRTMDTVAPVAEPAVVSVAANPDHTVLTVTGDGSVCPRLYRWQLDRFGPADEQGLKAGRALPAADASPDGRVFVYGLERGGADYLAATDGRNWGIRDMKDARFGPDGRLWTLEADRLRLALPPPSDGEVVWENDPPAAEAGRVLRVVAAGRHRVLVGRRDGWLFRIDLGTGAARAWPLLSSSVAGVAISPDGQTALVGGDGGELRLLDLESGTVAQVRDAHRGAVPAVVFGRQLLVSGSADRRVRLWTPTGDPIATLRMAGPVRKVLLSAEESSLLILVEGERAVRRWRLDSLFREWATLGIDSGVVRQTPPG